MEEPVRVQTTPTQPSNPPTTAQCPPPRPPAPTPSLPPKSKKRPLDAGFHTRNPKYSKIRAVVRELRPHFCEVLRAPDFRNCKAALEIREKMNLLMGLYKEITAETVSISKSKNVPASQPFLGENQIGPKPQEQPQDQQDKIPSKLSENKFLSGIASEKQGAEDGQIQGTYVVGGSAFGWNFITYLGNEPVYYGVTKESFRTSNPLK